MTPSNARSNRDVEIVASAPPTTRSAQKRRQQVESDDDYSPGVEGSQAEQSDSNSATLEIELQESPQVQKQPKRPRKTAAPARPEEGLDLSNYEFEEGSRIGQELPVAQTRVSFVHL
jgi:hypothetical protein